MAETFSFEEIVSGPAAGQTFSFEDVVGPANEQSSLAPAIPDITTAEGRGVTSAFQFSSEGINRFADAALGIPDALMATVANIPSPANVARNAANIFTGSDEIANTSLLEDITGIQPPQLGDQILPIPSAEEMRAGVSAGLDVGSPLNVEQRFDLARAEQEQRKQEFPFSTAAGQIAGDVATIATGRAPFARAAQARQIAPPGTALTKFTGPGFRRAVNDAFRSKSVSGLGKAAGKATGVGLEGATIAILQEGDPIEVGAYAAGGQVAGSTFLKLGTTGKGLLGVAGAALAAGSVLQMLDSATPGGRNFILPNIEAGYDKVLFALTAGALSGLAGAGRLRGRGFENFPALVDGITTFPRTAAISLLNDAVKDDDDRMKATVSTLTEDPEFFNPTERNRLVGALKSGDVSLLDTIDDMVKIKSFRRKLDEINPQEFPATAS